jgi:hypothetical protein
LRDVEQLSKSHIIPKSLILFGRDKASKEPMLLIPSNKTNRVQRSQAGIYSEIVCPECEASFQKGDDAVLAFCRTFTQGVPVPNKGAVVICRTYPTMENAALHRGVLTTLFRAHLSTHPLFKAVDLGRHHADCIRQLLLSSEPSHESGYKVVLRVIPSFAGSVITSPLRERWWGVNAYRLYLPYVSAFIKVDRRAFAMEMDSCALGAFNVPHAIFSDDLSAAERQRLLKVTVGRDLEVERYMDRKPA